MKKTILNFALIIAVLFAASCKNETKSDAADSAEKTEEVEKTEKAEEKSNEETTTAASDGVPSFSDEKVQEYVNSYEAYIEEYKKVVESKDMTAFASLGQKGQELGTKAQEVMGNLSGDDVKKLNDYMTAKSAELQELSKKLMQ
ncbi:hypothetical protein J8L88_05860 [Aquimarina sp. MMG015]|uniref:hypothetical protein n=1 Tax=Aquimarina TaxID=290174 RepID=UPI00041E4EC7|nr:MULTISPECIES: hypothetical protein [Aquimarina]AXT55406.1 hypothetical protein D1815_06405 [Aquimarina sp. AD1]MBQ4802376.1 hypothetical protein [Aquimarina sp. MMG015]RKN23239.1 hypothetical protein D7035_11550 [Aquimarina sp. AD1]